ncbi:MAG: hypothetical protein ACP5O4_03780, partial [bacterium]
MKDYLKVLSSFLYILIISEIELQKKLSRNFLLKNINYELNKFLLFFNLTLLLKGFCPLGGLAPP